MSKREFDHWQDTRKRVLLRILQVPVTRLSLEEVNNVLKYIDPEDSLAGTSSQAIDRQGQNPFGLGWQEDLCFPGKVSSSILIRDPTKAR